MNKRRFLIFPFAMILLAWPALVTGQAPNAASPAGRGSATTAQQGAPHAQQASPTTQPAAPIVRKTPSAQPLPTQPAAPIVRTTPSAQQVPAQQTTPAQPGPTQPAPAAQSVPLAPAPPHPQPAQYKNVIVLDPAHGGTDAGASISATTPEKALTLAFAAKLRPLLAAQGFSVVVTRDSDPGDVLASNQRAGVANHARPLACLVLHFAADGGGVHLATSSLAPADATASRFAVRWATAQAGMVTQSRALSHDLSEALDAAHLPVIEMRASVPPLDNLICPAVAVEIAPHKVKDGQATAVTDAGYQQSVAQAIVTALANYRTEVFPASVLPASAVAPEGDR